MDDEELVVVTLLDVLVVVFVVELEEADVLLVVFVDE